MDLIDEIDQLLTQKGSSPSEIQKLIATGSNSYALRDPMISRRAILALNTKNMPEALSSAWYAVQRNPTLPEYRMLLGKVFLACHEIDLALESFESAVALQPDNFDYQFIYLQTLYLRRPALAQTITREIAKYVTARSLDQYVAFAKHLRVSVEGGAWCEDGFVTIWMPKDGQRTYAKFRVSWMDRGSWASEMVELSDDSDRSVSKFCLPWRSGAELCTIKKARNGELLHGCPLFGKLADKFLPWDGRLPDPETRSVQVIIPVYKGLKETRDCLDSVLLSDTSVPFKVTVVLDNPSDAKLAKFIDGLEPDARVTIIRNIENIGFTASVNRALDTNEGEDVVLLNADTVVPNGWLERLKRAALSAPDIGTVTPISNNGEIVSFPVAREQNQIPRGLTLADIDRIAAEVNRGTYIDLPTGVGFCMFIRAETLHAVGRLDSFNFGRGYGEETDFCMRARAIGWRSICATDVFVEHVSKVSFGVEKDALARLNMKRVQKKHPEYNALMQGFLAEEPLLQSFRQLEREILPKRKENTWTLVVAPVDWRTNPALEKMRSDAVISGKPVLWLYHDSRIMDRLWLTSDATFEFGRLFYDLASEVALLEQDVCKLDIDHVHWFEPPMCKVLADVLARQNIPQTCHLASTEMAKFLTSEDQTAQMLTRSCETVHTHSEYGTRLAKGMGFRKTVETTEASVLLFPETRSSLASVKADKTGVSIAVMDGFRSHHGIAKLLEMARYVSAQDWKMTFYLFANTLQDIPLSRTGKVASLGFVDPIRFETMLNHLECDAVLSVNLVADPAPIVLKRVAPLVEQVFCFEGAERSELAGFQDNITLLDPTLSGEAIAQRLFTTFHKPDERIACAV